MTDKTHTAETLTDLAAIKLVAGLIRTRANLAAGSPWKVSPVFSPRSDKTSGVYSHAHPMGTVASEVVASGRVKPGYGGIRNPHNAVHIASFADPAVALALADWLDDVIAYAESGGYDDIDGYGALAVSRAYLAGEPR